MQVKKKDYWASSLESESDATKKKNQYYHADVLIPISLMYNN